MKALALYLLAALFLAAIGFIGWTGWRGTPVDGGLVVRSTAVESVRVGVGGDTLPGLADKLGIQLNALRDENASLSPTAVLTEGTEVILPADRPSWQTILGTHAAGLGAEFIGVFLSFWLALAVGIIPKGYRVQIFSISFVLAFASYAAIQAGASGDPALTPQFLFAGVKDGFAWSTAFPMFAWALGIRDRKDGASGSGAAASGRKPATDGVPAAPAAPAAPADSSSGSAPNPGDTGGARAT